MTDQKVILESLAMDLKRVSLGLHRGSLTMAKRFAEEALKRKEEINQSKVDPYVRKLLNELDKKMVNLDLRAAEDMLMYSILFQNYSIKFLK